MLIVAALAAARVTGRRSRQRLTGGARRQSPTSARHASEAGLHDEVRLGLCRANAQQELRPRRRISPGQSRRQGAAKRLRSTTPGRG